MQIGIMFTVVAFLATLFSAWFYLAAIRTEKSRNLKKGKTSSSLSSYLTYARVSFLVMVLAVTFASIYLLYLILSHQFQVSYVYQYSSRDLPLGFLISSFWAGQEGSFLLWTFLTAVMGIVLIKTGKSFESHAMLIINVVQGFFLLILIKASPFELLPTTPPDGAGLNPLLQNPWMVIHPPVLFIGYAAAAFPFAIAVAALARREYQHFVSYALPWALFTSITLGAGIIIGGYWAYKVLGWGGYWGWDPVENSSLIPWLTTLAMVHGLIVEKMKGALTKTNLLLAIFSFVLVLYATFLTRSGVLADFSVHSFQDLGINIYLIFFMLTVLVIGFGMFFYKYREIAANPLDITSLNREMILLFSMFVFLLSAIFTFLGTSSPIITNFFGEPAQVGIDFYNRVHLPIGIVMALILGFAPFLRWINSGAPYLLKSLTPSLILTAISTVVAVYFGIRDPGSVVFVGASFFAFWSNAITSARLLRRNWQASGAPLAHVGVALMFVGIIASAVLATDQRVILEQGVPQKALGYELVYDGITPVANGKDIVNIRMTSKESSYLAQPRFYFSTYNNSVMREPDVRAGILYDLYLSPLEKKQFTEEHAHEVKLVMRKGERKPLGDFEVFFKGFEFTDHSQQGAIRVGVQLEVTNGGNTYQLVPAIILAQKKKHVVSDSFMIETDTGDKIISVILNRMNADQKAIELLFREKGGEDAAAAPPKEQLMVEVSKKPLMSVLWLGTILIIGGTIIAFYRRLTPMETIIPQREEKKHARHEGMSEVSYKK